MGVGGVETENFHVVGEWKGPGVILGEEPLVLGDEARADCLRGEGGNDDVLGGGETIEAKAGIGAGETALSFSSFVLVGAMLSRTSSSLPSTGSGTRTAAASVDSASSRGAAFSNRGEGIVAPGLMLLLLEAIFAWGLSRPPARVPDAEGIVAGLSDPSAPAASRSSPSATDRLIAESLSSASPPSSAETNGSSLDAIVADAA